jgi:hypothetical protein
MIPPAPHRRARHPYEFRVPLFGGGKPRVQFLNFVIDQSIVCQRSLTIRLHSLTIELRADVNCKSRVAMEGGAAIPRLVS